jgi:ABC-2 type transport system ATP-binding protein
VEAAKRPLKNFSGGMRRKLDLAASLITRPPLLFLDEPTTGLDPRTRAQMWTTIRSLVADGSTVLLTTQYLDEADQLADRIAVIDRGRVVAEGTADDLKASVGASSLQVRVTAADLQPARALIATVLGVEAALSPEAARITAPMQDPAVTADLLIRLRDAGIAVEEVSVQNPAWARHSWRSPATMPPTRTTQQARREPRAHDRRHDRCRNVAARTDPARPGHRRAQLAHDGLARDLENQAQP